MLQDVKKLGKKLDVISVKDGFARNFLFPQKLAVIADSQSLAQKKSVENKISGNQKKYEGFALKLAEEVLNFPVKVGEKGEVFEPVNKEKIKRSLLSLGYSDFEINLNQSLKKDGDHLVDISFPFAIKSKVKVRLTPKQP